MPRLPAASTTGDRRWVEPGGGGVPRRRRAVGGASPAPELVTGALNSRFANLLPPSRAWRAGITGTGVSSLSPPRSASTEGRYWGGGVVSQNYESQRRGRGRPGGGIPGRGGFRPFLLLRLLLAAPEVSSRASR